MRTLLKVVLGLLLLVGLIAGGIALFLDRGARVAVERSATRALDVPTTVESVSIQPFRGKVALEELEISNPEGFSEHPFLVLQDGSMQVQVKTLMKDVVNVPALELSGVTVRLESQGKKTNYGIIADNLKRGDKDAKEDPEAKRFVIGDLVIRDVKIDGDFSLDSVLGSTKTEVHVQLPPIRLRNLRDGKPSTIGQISEEVFKAVLEAATDEQIDGMPAALVKDIRDSLSGLTGAAFEIIEGAGGVVKDIGKGLGSGAKEVLEGAKDVFKKKD
jgi:hypothetical protein